VFGLPPRLATGGHGGRPAAGRNDKLSPLHPPDERSRGERVVPDGSGSAERRRGLVVLLTAAFLVRGLFLVAALPIGDPLDESYHYAYADFFSTAHRPPSEREDSMPVELERVVSLLPRSTRVGGARVTWGQWSSLPSGERERRRREALSYRPEARGRYAGPNYETQQPPLAYAVGAAILRVLPRASLRARLMTLRAFAVVVAAFAAPLAFLLFRRLFALPAAAAATLAFVAYPGPATFTGRFTNDALGFPIAIGLLVLLIRAADGKLSRGQTLLLAAVLGIGAWTKLSFLPLCAAPVLAALVAPRGLRRTAIRRAAVASFVGLVAVAPWLLRQRVDSGDWLGMTASKAMGRAPAGRVRPMARAWGRSASSASVVSEGTSSSSPPEVCGS